MSSLRVQMLLICCLFGWTACQEPAPTPTEAPSPSEESPSSESPVAESPTSEPTQTPELTETPATDSDHDGSFASLDCDDTNPDVYPGASETPYNGLDEDCSGEDLIDVDQDGVPALAANGSDCDDSDPSTYPGAPEYADDRDNDCDGSVDEALDTTDDDQDGYAESEGDCNDASAQQHPGAQEVPYDGIDQDCSGSDLIDVDGDGSAGGPNGSDCDDTEGMMFPGATEVPYDGMDQDCSGADLNDLDGDGAIGGPGGSDCDDQDPSRAPGKEEIPYDGIDQDCTGADWIDVDEDGQAALSAGGTDCNDNEPLTYAGASEVPYDGRDQDCSGDDLIDVDQDGVASEEVEGLDCDDVDPLTYPGASELADGIDNDCDGKIDEGLNSTDDDGDGFSELTGDCNDADAAIYPTAAEVPYDGTDQDCAYGDLLDVDQDGANGGPEGTDCDDSDPNSAPGADELPYDGVDQDCSGSDLNDVDQDGFNGGTGGSDCNDQDPLLNPGASEIPYDNIDQDCSGSDLTDVDGDGYGSSVVGGADCNDATQAISPVATEVCDSIDNNCDGIVDTNAVDRSTFYTDGDRDGFGNPALSTLSCTGSSTLVKDNTDCDDSYDQTYPGAAEQCDGADNDCDGQLDEEVQNTYYKDGDGDGYGALNASVSACAAPLGYVSDSSDCNDSLSAVNPAASESCNSRDDNCDGQIDEGVTRTYYQDADGDTYGNPAVSTSSCSAPNGYVSNNTDCNDSSASASPAQQEQPFDGLDNNCDGSVDNVSTTGLPPCPSTFSESFSGTSLPSGWKIMGSANQVWTFSGGVANQTAAYGSIWAPGASLSPSCVVHSTYTVEVDTYLSSSGDFGHNGIIYGLKESALSTTCDANYSYYRTHSDHITNWSCSSGESIYSTGTITNQKWYRYKIEVNRPAGWMKVYLDGKLIGQVTGAQQSASGPRIALWTADQARFDNFLYKSP